VLGPPHTCAQKDGQNGRGQFAGEGAQGHVPAGPVRAGALLVFDEGDD
jgi:hypothetical protein